MALKHTRSTFVVAIAFFLFASYGPEVASTLPTSDELNTVLHRLESSIQFTTSRVHRLNSLGYRGVAARLRAFLLKVIQGHPISLGVVGGSISAGQGCGGPRSTFSTHFFRWIHHQFPHPNHTLHNAAIAGTTSPYISACLDGHLPGEVDLVMVEYTMNDRPAPDEHWDEAERHAYERLLRKLLSLPNYPAVLLIHMYSPCKGKPCGKFWDNAERDFSELARYYHLPEISLKASLHHEMMKATALEESAKLHNEESGSTVEKEAEKKEKEEGDGKSGSESREEDVGEDERGVDRKSTMLTVQDAEDGSSKSSTSAKSTGWGGWLGSLGGQGSGGVEGTMASAAASPLRFSQSMFFVGKSHPGHDGHRVIGEMIITLALEVLRDMVIPDPSVELIMDIATAPIPGPMVPGNHAWPRSVCLVGSKLRDEAVKETDGFEFLIERLKSGFIGTKPGSWVDLAINTTSPAGDPSRWITIQLSLLKSYEQQGQAKVTCQEGCQCKTTVFDGYDPAPVSLEVMHTIKVTQSSDCVIRVTVEKRTSSPDGGTKVKVTGLVLSEEVLSNRTAGMIHGKLRVATRSDGNGRVTTRADDLDHEPGGESRDKSDHEDRRRWRR